MKIDVITFSRAKNYGGILQAYALYHQLETMGHDVEFIDYIIEGSNVQDRSLFVKQMTSKSRIWGMNVITRWLWGLFYYSKIKADYMTFSNFIEERVRFSKKYYSEMELKTDPPIADLYITGSDQVWNSWGSQSPTGREFDLPFYLSFIKNKRKISYASSFGRSQLSEKHYKVVKKYLTDYEALSVREVEGQQILAKAGIESSVVVDPTILCNPKMWKNMTSRQPVEGNYTLVYQVRYDERIAELAKCVTNGKKQDLITICMTQQEKHKIKGKVLMTPKVEEWLSLIKNADLIITDSFHATVFSLLFHKPFLVNSATRKGMSGRITHLLKMLDLSEYEMTDFDIENAEKIISNPIEWDRVDYRMEQLRMDSQKWLKDAVEKNAI